MNPPAGWHPDPYDPSIDRYWDGQQWTNQTRPRGSGDPTQVFGAVGQGGNPPAAGGSKRRKWPWALGAGLVGLVALGAAVGDEEPKTETSSVVSTTSSSVAPTTTTAKPATTTPRATTPAPTTTSDSPAVVPLVPQVGTTVVETTTEYTPPPAPAHTPPATTEYTSPPVMEYTPPPAPAQQSGGTVHGGSFCSTPGATGVTTKGTPMVCAPGKDGRDRWQSPN